MKFTKIDISEIPDSYLKYEIEENIIDENEYNNILRFDYSRVTKKSWNGKEYNDNVLEFKNNQ